MTLVSKAIKRPLNVDGSISTVIPTPPPDVEWVAVPNYTNNERGVAFSETVRAFATGTGAATAALTLVSVSGATASDLGLEVTGDSLETSAATIGSGSFRYQADYSGNSFYSNDFTFSIVTGSEGFPLHDVYSDIVTARGGTPIPESNTRYWDKPTYPTSGTVYTSVSALQTALNSASPGDTLFLQDGTYSDSAQITCSQDGNSSNPIQICAETKGGVTFTGDLDFLLTGDFIDLMGFRFTGDNNNVDVIRYQGDDNLIAYNHYDNLICGNASNNQRYFYNVNAARGRVCYNTISNKKSNRTAIRSTNTSTYERIDHNHVDRTGQFVDANDPAAVQIDQSGASRDHYALVDNNYFYRINSDGSGRWSDDSSEMIVNKSSSNAFIRNYFFECCGTANDRESNRSTWYANIIDGNGVNHSGGIQLGGEDSYAFCNYIARINPNDAGGMRGLCMRQGGNSSYETSVDNEISFNLVTDSERSFAMGAGGSGSDDPSGCLWYNNACDLATQDGPSFNPDDYDDITAGGNIVESPSGLSPVPSGFTVAVPGLTNDNGYLVPTDSGNLDGAGVTGWNSLCTVDLLGNAIPDSNPNIGPFQSGWSLTTDPAQTIIDNAGHDA